MPPYPAAANNTSTACVPSHWSMAQCVVAFRLLFADCEDIWHFGQFAWSRIVARVAPRGKPNKSAWEVHTKCGALLDQDKLADIVPWVQNNVVADGALISGVGKMGVDKCFDFAGRVARFIRGRGGLKGCFGTSGDLNRPIYSGSDMPGVPAGQTGPVAPWWQLVRYDKRTLASVVATLRDILDAGYVVRAGCMSGVRDDKGLNDPDHYILLLGYDGDEFVYWDTDSMVSNRPPFGPTFGTLTYYNPALPAFQAAGYSAADADRFHRLGNTHDDTELQCDGVGNFTLSTPSGISHTHSAYPGITFDEIRNYGFQGNDVDFRKLNHRYQVTHIFPKS